MAKHRKEEGAGEGIEASTSVTEKDLLKTMQSVDLLTPVKIPKMDLGNVVITLDGREGVDVITNQFSAKAMRQILDAQMKVPGVGKEARNPYEEYMASMYLIKAPTKKDLSDGIFGFSSIGVKLAMATAAGDLDRFFPAKILRAVQIYTVLIPFLDQHTGRPAIPHMRQDYVRHKGTTSIRFRSAFVDWRLQVPITFNRRVISLEMLVNLAEMAGFGVGIGEWRPPHKGIYGTWQVSREQARAAA